MDYQQPSLIGKWVRQIVAPHKEGVCIEQTPRTIRVKFDELHSETVWAKDFRMVSRRRLTSDQLMLLEKIRSNISHQRKDR